jgi:hypothetical protein
LQHGESFEVRNIHEAFRHQEEQEWAMSELARHCGCMCTGWRSDEAPTVNTAYNGGWCALCLVLMLHTSSRQAQFGDYIRFVWPLLQGYAAVWSGKPKCRREPEKSLRTRLNCNRLFNQHYLQFRTFKPVLFTNVHCNKSGPGIVVGIATGYGLEGPGIESRWRRDFPHLYRPALGPTQPSVFPGGKERPGREADPSPPSSAVVMKE